MFDFHEKRKIRSILYSKPVVFVLFTGAVLMSFSVYDRYSIAKDIQGRLEGKHAELEDLRERAAALEAKVQYLEDERGIEEELRSRFDVRKEGEQVIILLDPDRQSSKRDVDTTLETPHSEAKSFWDHIKFW